MEARGLSSDGAIEDVAAAAASEPKRGDGHPATWALIALNLLIFALMLPVGPIPALVQAHRWQGLLTAQFPVETLLRCGASDSSLVLAGQWWRVVTATFLHANVVHIAINLWCLWNLGVFAERLVGRPGAIAIYLLTGAAGNLASLAFDVFTRRDGVVVGASGAVFGIAGVLIVLLSNQGLTARGVPLRELKVLRGQVVLFAVVNYALGVAPGYMSPNWLTHLHMDPRTATQVDNSAHLGGLVFGLLLGLALYPWMLRGRVLYRRRQAVVFAGAVLVLAMFGYATTTFAAGGR